MSPNELLNRAADLIENLGWCQGAAARNKAGRAVFVDAPSAAAFCPIGAMNRVVGWRLGPVYWAARAMLRRYVGQDIGLWNDQPGQLAALVVAGMRAAAQRGPAW